MPLTPDTTSVAITGKDGNADYGINGQSYRNILDMFRIREITELFNTDVFAIEGTADQEAGRSQLHGEVSGLCKQHGPASGPLIPAPQSVPIVAIYTTNCQISYNANFSEANADRLVNQNARIGGRNVSKGVYSVSWVKV